MKDVNRDLTYWVSLILSVGLSIGAYFLAAELLFIIQDWWDGMKETSDGLLGPNRPFKDQVTNISLSIVAAIVTFILCWDNLQVLLRKFM